LHLKDQPNSAQGVTACFGIGQRGAWIRGMHWPWLILMTGLGLADLFLAYLLEMELATLESPRVPVIWSSVANFRAARVGATKPGRCATRNPSLFVCAAAAAASRNPSGPSE
jgi:hypothetical protein